ncbi:hypothetical protein QUF70_09650 [Desulfobacterales bacterium HSG17]|nr:hypothetical protein [Desulfobacterales bacterium HSG17]
MTPPEGAEIVPHREQIIPLISPAKASKGTLMEKDDNSDFFQYYEDNDLKTFDENIPVTTILVHSWTNDGIEWLHEKAWVKRIAEWILEDGRSNVIAYNWLEQSATDDPPPIHITERNGVKLAILLAKFIKDKNYERKLHFISHSAGSRVAHTAVNLLTIF